MASHTRLDDEDHVFRLPKYAPWIGFASALFGVTFVLLFGGTGFGATLRNPSWGRAVALVLLCGFFSGFVLYGLYLIAAYPKTRVLINKDRVAVVGLLRTKEVPITPVTTARFIRAWRSPSMIYVKAHGCSLYIWAAAQPINGNRTPAELFGSLLPQDRLVGFDGYLVGSDEDAYALATTPELECPRCGEKCPTTFDVCWNCGASVSSSEPANG